MSYTAQQTVDVLSRAADVIRYMVRADLAAAMEAGEITTGRLEEITAISETADRVADVCSFVETYVGVTATPIPVE